ncbi:30S ribosomal protein S17 [Candidatus Woesearchaeota archaeon]|nr:30S ribosomal protein S17P [uncultured archaeon]MBS3157086.1 30S ribosomal protein S17 [Candidatus Woesearchaeota archaeon]
MKTKNEIGITTHGRIFVGRVKSAKAQKTAVVEWERTLYLRKYERYEKRLSKIQVHIPDSIEVKEGDIVKIAECRPLSKTKHFVIIENESN